VGQTVLSAGRNAAHLADRTVCPTGHTVTCLPGIVRTGGQPLSRGELERQKAGARKGQPKVRPIVCDLSLNRLLGANLARNEQELREFFQSILQSA
jgi:hypothetical protein